MDAFFVPSLQTLQSLSSFAVAAPPPLQSQNPAKRSSKRSASQSDAASLAANQLDQEKPKRGRKLAPLPEEPENKRLAQNRIAQRAFRERKVNHVKDLETKVAELTAIVEGNTLMASALELSTLKKRVEALEEENESLRAENNQLRQMSFSFDPSQMELSPVEGMDLSADMFTSPLLPTPTTTSTFNATQANADFVNQSNADFANMLMNSMNAMNTQLPSTNFVAAPVAAAPIPVPVVASVAPVPTPVISTLPAPVTAPIVAELATKQDPSVLDFMSLLNFDTFRSSPPATELDSFLFDDVDFETLLPSSAPFTSTIAPTASVAKPEPIVTTTAITTPTTTLMPLESLKRCMSSKAAASPTSMSPQFSCVQKALASVPSLATKPHLIEELCSAYTDFTTRCDTSMGPITCPQALLNAKKRVLEEAGGWEGYVRDVFDVVRVKHQEHLERKIRGNCN